MNVIRFLMVLLVFSAPVCVAEEVLEELKLGKETFKEVRVIQASPIDLLIGHEGGYKRIKLQDLPSPWKQKYPYDAKKAEEYERQKAAEARLRPVQNAAQIRAGLLLKEDEIKKKLAPLEKELMRLKSDLKVQNAIARGRGSKSDAKHAADGLRASYLQAQDKVYALKDELEKTEATRKKFE
jgi:hypothetical protein